MEQEITKYIEYLFHVALQKCGNLHDAEDLTNDTLLVAFQYMNSGKQIANMKYFLTSTLSHKWNDRLREKYKLPLISMDMCEEIMDIADEDVSDRPDAEAVRREVAYLSSLYREVIVLHYLKGMRVEDIAKKLGIPRGTVLSRLSSGREQMRKGFEKMEGYEKQSYTPDRLDISCYGCRGFHDEPWSLVASDMMKQNILIVAYEKPITTGDIAKALGIPTAYIEKAVDDLISSELMARAGNKVFTDFMIVTPNDMLKGLDAEIELVEEHYPELLSFVCSFLSELGESEVAKSVPAEKFKKLEYYFVLHLFSNALYTATQRIVPSKEEYPPRPDGGRWIAVGTKYPHDFDFENYKFGKYCYGGMRGIYWENYLSAKSIDLKIYDAQPDLNKYNHAPIEISDDDISKLLYIISRGIPFEQAGFNTMFCEDIPHLTQCGVLGNKNGTPFVNIPMLTPDEYSSLDKIRIKHMHLFADKLEGLLREVFPKLKIDIPTHLVGRVAEFRRYSCYSIPMAFMKKAIEQHDFDFANATPPMVFVVDDQNPTIR